MKLDLPERKKGRLILKFKPHKDFVNSAFSERFGSLSIYDGNGSENVTQVNSS